LIVSNLRKWGVPETEVVQKRQFITTMLGGTKTRLPVPYVRSLKASVDALEQKPSKQLFFCQIA